MRRAGARRGPRLRGAAGGGRDADTAELPHVRGRLRSRAGPAGYRRPPRAVPGGQRGGRGVVSRRPQGPCQDCCPAPNMRGSEAARWALALACGGRGLGSLSSLAAAQQGPATIRTVVGRHAQAGVWTVHSHTGPQDPGARLCSADRLAPRSVSQSPRALVLSAAAATPEGSTCRRVATAFHQPEFKGGLRPSHLHPVQPSGAGWGVRLAALVCQVPEEPGSVPAQA